MTATTPARPGPKRAVNVRSGLAQALKASTPALTDEAISSAVESIVDFLSEPAVVNQFAEIVHEALLSSAHYADEFGGVDQQKFWDTRDCAEIAVATVRDLIAEAEEARLTLDDAPRIHHLLQGVRYRDWKFSLVQLGGRPAVLASASVPNVYDADRSFTTSRSAVITDDILEAVYRVVLQLEEHEARERFKIGSTRPLNPHAGDSSMPPSEIVERRIGNTNAHPPVA